MHQPFWLALTVMVASVSDACEEDRANYSVFYEVGTDEEATLFPCLQCFALPCVSDREKVRTPIDGSKKYCCRRCSRVAAAGSACSLQRDESAVVCHKGSICSVTQKVCVEECPLPPMP